MYLPKVNLLFSLGRYADAELVLREALSAEPQRRVCPRDARCGTFSTRAMAQGA